MTFVRVARAVSRIGKISLTRVLRCNPRTRNYNHALRVAWIERVARIRPVIRMTSCAGNIVPVSCRVVHVRPVTARGHRGSIPVTERTGRGARIPVYEHVQV